MGLPSVPPARWQSSRLCSSSCKGFTPVIEREGSWPGQVAGVQVGLYEVFPLVCPLCGGSMRIIAFITHSADIRQILEHIGVESEPPHIAPARGPPLWEDFDAQVGEGSQIEPDWDIAAQPAGTCQ